MHDYKLSNTAIRKMARINVALSEIEFAIKKGQKVHRTGAVFYFLGKNDLPDGTQFEKLNGLAVIVEDRTIITVYKNKKSLHNIKRKAKRNFWKEYKGRGRSRRRLCPFHSQFSFCECDLDKWPEI